MKKGFKPGEFAGLAGVTVKALHHYDRIGLLKPQRSSSGVRVYSLGDLERLEEIVALKFLGIPLKEIKYLLETSKSLSILESLDFQRHALGEKRRLIDRAMRAIESATKAIQSGDSTPASVLKNIMEIIDMKSQGNFMRKYYSEQAWLEKTQLVKDTPTEVHIARAQQWKELFVELESALDLDPSCETAQALTQRWLSLAAASTGSNDEIRVGGINAWKDHENWPVAEQDALLRAYGLDSDDRASSMRRVENVASFIGKVISGRVRSNWRDLFKPDQV